MVTGPSFTSATCMSAPNSPVGTSRPSSSATRAVKRSYIGRETASGARPDVRRAVALAGRSLQRELAHHQHLAAYLPHVEVHHPLLVVENPQTDQLARQILHIFVRVLHAHADQHQQALPDPDSSTPPTLTEAFFTR